MSTVVGFQNPLRRESGPWLENTLGGAGRNPWNWNWQQNESCYNFDTCNSFAFSFSRHREVDRVGIISFINEEPGSHGFNHHRLGPRLQHRGAHCWGRGWARPASPSHFSHPAALQPTSSLSAAVPCIRKLDSLCID